MSEPDITAAFKTAREALEGFDSTWDDIRAALSTIEARLADAEHERDLAYQARDNWRQASDEKLAEVARLRAEVERLTTERDEWKAARGEPRDISCPYCAAVGVMDCPDPWHRA